MNAPANAPQGPPHDEFVRALAESQAALRGFCEAALGHNEEAKDAWQRTNLVLWRKAHEWDPQTKFLRWAISVARFEVLSVIRDRQRQRLVFHDDVAELMTETAVAEVEVHSSRRDALLHCLEKLQPRHREMLTEHYVLGRSQAEIAHGRAMNVSALKVLLLRLRRSLAECITRQLMREAQS